MLNMGVLLYLHSLQGDATVGSAMCHLGFIQHYDTILEAL